MDDKTDMDDSVDDKMDEGEEKKKKKKKKGQDDDWSKNTEKRLENYYEVLGLSEQRWRATDADIKKQYRKLCLVHHPDKHGGVEDETFKAIQTAWEVVGNRQSRLAYDSQEDDDFDERIPADHVATLSAQPDAERDAAFFEAYGPVFDRNAKWSTDYPNVPRLGDMDTSEEDVVAFYDYWYKFPSWRSFGYVCEFDPTEAADGKERRWMIRENEKIQSRLLKAENARIRRLASNAHERDPRVRNISLRELEARRKEEEERRAKAAEDARVKKERAEMERRTKENAAKAKKSVDAQKKAEREAARLRRKACMDVYRKLVAEHCTGLASMAEDFVIKLDHQAFASFVDTLSSQSDIRSYVQSQHDLRFGVERVMVVEEKMVVEEEVVEIKVNWSEEEKNQLARLCVKYPVGTRNRWAILAEGMARPESEVIEMVKTLKESDSKAYHTTPESWSHEEMQRLQEGLKRFGKSMGDKRWEAIASVVGHRSVAEIQKQYALIAEQVRQRRAAAAAATPETKTSLPWTKAEINKLQTALAKYPKTTPERWEKIAALIGSRNRDEVVLEFKRISEELKSKKK